MNVNTNFDFEAGLSMALRRADGSVEHFDFGTRPVVGLMPKPLSWYEKLWKALKREGKIATTMGLGAFIGYCLMHGHGGVSFGVVTTAGVDYIASAFSGGSSISNFNYHDCGTGGAHGSTINVAGATNASPIVIQTSSAHGLTTNDLATVASVGGNTAANGSWQINVVDSTNFSLIGSSGSGAYTSGGTVQLLNGAGDTALTTAAGTARVLGAQSNPTANQYKSVATVSFTSSLTISEWGLFSASTSGTLLDRRWFNTAGAPATTATSSLTGNPIGVNNGDSISFQYSLVCTSGGS